MRTKYNNPSLCCYGNLVKMALINVRIRLFIKKYLTLDVFENRVRSWNNGICCMFYYVLIKYSMEGWQINPVVISFYYFPIHQQYNIRIFSCMYFQEWYCNLAGYKIYAQVQYEILHAGANLLRFLSISFQIWWEVKFSSHLDSSKAITTKFCTWCNSHAVVACVKIVLIWWLAIGLQ